MHSRGINRAPHKSLYDAGDLKALLEKSLQTLTTTAEQKHSLRETAEKLKELLAALRILLRSTRSAIDSAFWQQLKGDFTNGLQQYALKSKSEVLRLTANLQRARQQIQQLKTKTVSQQKVIQSLRTSLIVVASKHETTTNDLPSADPPSELFIPRAKPAGAVLRLANNSLNSSKVEDLSRPPLSRSKISKNSRQSTERLKTDQKLASSRRSQEIVIKPVDFRQSFLRNENQAVMFNRHKQPGQLSSLRISESFVELARCSDSKDLLQRQDSNEQQKASYCIDSKKETLRKAASKEKLVITLREADPCRILRSSSQRKVLMQQPNIAENLRGELASVDLYLGDRRAEQMYEGDMHEGLRQGKGILRFVNGLLYEGQFRDGFRSGQGSLYLNGQAVYEGGWKGDQLSGFGTLSHLYLINKRKISQGSLLYGCIYTGSFKENRLHGSGLLTLSGKQKFQGQFQNGLPVGTFKYHNQRGQVQFNLCP